MSDFYKKYPHLCVTDLTKGQMVQIKVSEYDRDIVAAIRHRSGFNDETFLK